MKLYSIEFNCFSYFKCRNYTVRRKYLAKVTMKNTCVHSKLNASIRNLISNSGKSSKIMIAKMNNSVTLSLSRHSQNKSHQFRMNAQSRKLRLRSLDHQTGPSNLALGLDIIRKSLRPRQQRQQCQLSVQNSSLLRNNPSLLHVISLNKIQL